MTTLREAVTGTGQTTATERRRLIIDALSNRWRIIPVIFSVVVIWGVFAAQSPAFLTARNLSNLAEQIAVTSIIALGIVFVLLIGEIDLSVATLSAVSGAIAGVLVVQQGLSLFPAIGVAILFGGSFGVLQGTIIVLSGAPALIVTLGGQMVLQALLLIFIPATTGLVPLAGTSLQSVAGSRVPPLIAYVAVVVISMIVLLVRWFEHRRRLELGLESSITRVLVPSFAILLGSLVIVAVFNSYQRVPTPIAILAVLLVILSFVMRQTRFGTWLYAIGGNREAARRAGIPVKRMRISAFGILGVLAAVGGVVAASRVLGVSPASDDQSLLLEAIAAAVIGGTSLFGGRGNVWSAVIGALVIGSIASGMLLLNSSTELRLLVQGMVLVAAVVADALIARNSRAVGK